MNTAATGMWAGATHGPSPPRPGSRIPSPLSNSYKKETTMRCPVCTTELVKGRERKYETLHEHVTDPNKEDYPYRPTWECPLGQKQRCIMFSFWDPDGGYYGGARGTPEHSSALGSWEREYDDERVERDRRHNVFFRRWWRWLCKPAHDLHWKIKQWAWCVYPPKKWPLTVLQRMIDRRPRTLT